MVQVFRSVINVQLQLKQYQRIHWILKVNDAGDKYIRPPPLQKKEKKVVKMMYKEIFCKRG